MNRAIAATLLCLLSLGIAAAQEEGVLLSANFDENSGGFITMDQQATLKVSHKAADLYKDKPSLKLSYFQRVPKQQPGAADLPASLMLPVAMPQPELAGLSLALTAKIPTPVVVILSVGDNGPRYQRVLWCEAENWSEFVLGLDEFTWDPDSPADPNGKLIPEKITGIGLLDMGTFLRGMASKMPFLHVDPPQQQALLLGEFKLLAAAKVPKLATPPEGLVPIADYEPPLRGVAVIGGTNVGMSDDDGQSGGKALKIEYTTPPHTILAVIHQVGLGALKDVRALRFNAKSSGQVMLIVNLEQRGQGGAKTNFHAEVPLDPAAPWKTMTIPVSEFKPDNPAANPAATLDMSRVGMIAIADLTGGGEEKDLHNTLWLDNLVGVK